MTKRRKSKHNDQPNLKRFRSEVDSFLKEDNNPEFEHKVGKRKSQLSRKERRKEERILKKSRKLAFSQKKTLPTKDSIQNERYQEELKKKKEIKQKKKNNAKKEKRKQLTKKKEQELEERQRELDVQNMYENKEIRELEKKLNLKKRKSKNLPQSFVSDGLDYILDVVDPEKLQALQEEDEEKDPFGLEAGEESEDAYDEEDFEDEDFMDSDVDEDGSGDEDEAEENEQEESDILDTETVTNSSKTHPETPKKEKWEKLADKIQTLVDKKKKTKQKLNTDNTESDDSDSDLQEEKGATQKSNKKVTFAADSYSKVDDEEEEDEDQWDDIEEENFSDESDELEDKDNENEEDEIEEDEEGDESDTHDEEPVLKEDIYGRLRDAEGNIVKDNKPAGGGGAYVPPAKRLQMAAHSDGKRRIEMERLQKQLKGLVNRASESNIQPISSQIEGLYLSHSRADVNENLISLVWDACVSPVLTPERLAMELMMLVAILHGNVGSEVGAMFLQHLVKQLDRHLQSPQQEEGKEVDNIVQMLAHLYNFKVVHSVLLFDLLKLMVDSFQEKDIELILLILRNVGFSLRKDNPNELKTLILSIQTKAASVDTSDQSRVKFMLDIILAIRNNNMRKIPNYDPEHLEHLRKLIRNYIRGGQFGDNQLNVTWKDLQNADQKGKWWVIGSAWDGQGPKQPVKDSESLPAGIEQGVSTKLQELARKQRMNTDRRRSIFYIIMTSEDYIDAFEKLLKLGVKSSQQNEIVMVMLECCLQEQRYNPFYQYLSQRFCEHHRSFQMTFQFCLWDKFKEVERLKESSVQNLAKLLTHLFVSKGLSLSILKVITFGTLEKQMVRLLKQIFSEMLLEHPEQEVNAAFSRIATLEKLKPLHEGLRLFLQHFLVGKKRDSQNAKLVKRVSTVDSLLATKKSSMFL